MLKFIFLFMILFVNLFAEPKTRTFTHDSLNEFPVIKILQNRDNIKLIKSKGVKYFETLNENLIEAIKSEDILGIKKYIKAGADVRTGIYYGVTKNKTNALKELFKYDKIDLVNELYFIPYKYFKEEDKKYGYKASEFILNGDIVLYKIYNRKLLLITYLLNIMNLDTIKLVFNNIVNHKYIGANDRLLRSLAHCQDMEKLDYLISILDIDFYEILTKLFEYGKSETIVKFLEKYEKTLNRINDAYLYNTILFFIAYREESGRKFPDKKILKYLKKFKTPHFLDYHKKEFEKIFNSKYEDLKNIKIDSKLGNIFLEIFDIYYKKCSKYESINDKTRYTYMPKCIEKSNNCDKLKNFLFFIKDYNSVPLSYFCLEKEYFNDIEKITDFNKQRFNKIYPIFYAIEEDNMKLLEYILKKGGNPNIVYEKPGRPLYFFTPIDYAFYRRNKKATEILKKYNAKGFCKLYDYKCDSSHYFKKHIFKIIDN